MILVAISYEMGWHGYKYSQAPTKEQNVLVDQEQELQEATEAYGEFVQIEVVGKVFPLH